MSDQATETTLPPGDLVHLMFSMLNRARQRFGSARFEMGAVLATIHEHELWRGRATSFASFLEDAKINTSAGYQYMRVAKTFFFGLGLTADELDEVALVPMTLLDMAAKVITPENAHEILGIITTLNERDARVTLEEIQAGIPAGQGNDGLRLSPKVARLYSGFRDLPDEQRIEFMQQLSPQKAPKGEAPMLDR